MEQKTVGGVLLSVIVVPIAVAIILLCLLKYVFVWSLSSSSVGPYGDDSNYYQRTTNLYILQSGCFLEETVIDGFAPMMLQLYRKRPINSTLEEPAGLLLVDLPVRGGLDYPIYSGELSEDIHSFLQRQINGHHLSIIVLIQTPDTVYTSGWFSSSSEFCVSNLPYGQQEILNPEQLASLKDAFPKSDIIVYPETRGGLYHLSEDGSWEQCQPFTSKQDFVRGTTLNRLKKKELPESLMKSCPNSNDEFDQFGYTTN